MIETVDIPNFKPKSVAKQLPYSSRNLNSIFQLVLFQHRECIRFHIFPSVEGEEHLIQILINRDSMPLLFDQFTMRKLCRTDFII